MGDYSYGQIIELAKQVFMDDDKAYGWYLTPNKYFEDDSPYQYAGKSKANLKHVIKHLELMLIVD